MNKTKFQKAQKRKRLTNPIKSKISRLLRTTKHKYFFTQCEFEKNRGKLWLLKERLRKINLKHRAK